MESNGASAERPQPAGAPVAIAGRYLPERLLGAGAMGAVHLVRDLETGERLALKRLFRIDGKQILRLKREFRSLADVSHPHLVKVYDLGCENSGWFLTMEYVQGQEWSEYLCGSKASARSGVEAAISELLKQRSLRLERVLRAFRQLAAGVSALHRAGMLHRDIKPSNVMVADHRVVLLDFGLVRELDENAPQLTEEGAIAGTPAYMAPEQACGKTLTEATDWYSVGVMLYEALTGELPFDGPVLDLLHAKLQADPKPPRAIDADVPEHLDALCMELLARDPARRPSGAQVLERLGEDTRVIMPALVSDTGESTVQSEAQSRIVATPFFGRKAEVSALWQAMEQVDDGRTAVVHVCGVSGAGKSALVEQFLDQVEQRSSASGAGDALVLRSRCYEREAMPFKALDSVIDALSRHLLQQNDFEVSNILPSDIGVLATVFPALERVRAVQHLLSMRPPRGDAYHSRERAEAALRELFRRLTSRRPVVIWIDDLQWGDLDSARVLRGWLRHASELPLLMLLSYRSDEVATSESLKLLLEPLEEEPSQAHVSAILLDALPAEDLGRLCRERLGVLAAQQPELVDRIVRESQGSPFLAAQLTALAAAKIGRGHGDANEVTIADLIEQTSAMLPADARHLLSVLAVAGRPLAPKLAMRAAGIRHGGRETVHALRRLQLVRTRDVTGERLIEVYHDRVREGVHAQLSAEQSARIHAALLSALEYSGRADADWLHALALGAGETASALRYGMSAAARAAASLAFERAVELYSMCLSLYGGDDAGRAELYEKLALAQSACGRGGDAADSYLEAARLTEGEKALAWTRQAMLHLLRVGRFEEGEALLERVLAAMELEVPATTGRLLAAIVWARCKRKLGGMSYVARSEAEVPRAVLDRLDALDAIRLATSGADPVRGAYFLEREMQLALQAGEPLRVLRALCGIAYGVAISGGSRAERELGSLVAQASRIAEQIGTADARACLDLAVAVAQWMLARPHDALEPARRAQNHYRSTSDDAGQGSYHQRLIVTSIRIASLYEQTRYAMVIEELEPALQEARATQNLGALMSLALNETLLDELLGRPRAALRRLEQQRAALPTRAFGIHHALNTISALYAARVTSELEWGARVLEEDWARYRRSSIANIAYLAMLLESFRVCLLANQAFAMGESARVLPSLMPVVESVAKKSQSHGPAFVQIMNARLQLARGERRRAIAAMQTASELNKSPLRADHIALALAILQEDQPAIELIVAGQRAKGLRDPIAVARTFIPEFFSRA